MSLVGHVSAGRRRAGEAADPDSIAARSSTLGSAPELVYTWAAALEEEAGISLDR